MARTLAASWKETFRYEGASGDDTRLYSEALEHAETEVALQLIV